MVFLEKLPGQEKLEELREKVRKDGSEEMVWWPGDVEGGKEVVLLLPNGVGKAKCGAEVVEKVLGMKATMRGWRTLRLVLGCWSKGSGLCGSIIGSSVCILRLSSFFFSKEKRPLM